MKYYAVFFIAVAVLFTTATVKAQTSDTSTYKYKLTKTWYFNYSESFGVKSNPDSIQKHDMIIFNPNMSYQMTIDGASSTGTWAVSESTHFLTLTDSKTKQTHSYKVAGVIKDQMSIKWQAPDLTSVYKYFYSK